MPWKYTLKEITKKELNSKFSVEISEVYGNLSKNQENSKCGNCFTTLASAKWVLSFYGQMFDGSITVGLFAKVIIWKEVKQVESLLILSCDLVNFREETVTQAS